MSEIWPSTKVGDCCDILDNLRVPLNAEERDDIKGNIPYYGANGLQGYIDKFIFDEPLILLAEDGGYFDEYESRPIAYRVSGKSWINNHAHILRTKVGGSFSQDFVFYCLEHKNITPFIKGGTRAKLNQAELREILIPKPPELIQRRIAEIISTADKAIEQTEALIAKYQQIKAGLMQDLFTRGVTPNGHLRPTRTQAPHLYKDSPLGWIPKEWEVQRLDSVSEVSRGKFTIRPRNDPRFYGGRYPFIQTGDVALSGGRTLNIYSQTLNEMGLSVSRLFPPGTIMVTIAANIADTCIIGIPMCAPDSLVGVQPNVRENARFIELSIRRRKLWLEARAPQTAQRNINLEDLRPLLIPWPDGLERLRISEMYEAQDSAIATSERQVQKLRQQKQGLMQDLLTGRVRVKVGEAEAKR